MTYKRFEYSSDTPRYFQVNVWTSFEYNFRVVNCIIISVTPLIIIAIALKITELSAQNSTLKNHSAREFSVI